LVFTFDFAPARLSLQLSIDTSASMASARLWNYTSDAHPQSTEMLRRGKNRMPLENTHTGTRLVDFIVNPGNIFGRHYSISCSRS